MDRFELRRLDYSLSEDHVAVQGAYQQFFKTHCPIETVRAAELSGFDRTCGSACAPWAPQRWRCPNPPAVMVRHWST